MYAARRVSKDATRSCALGAAGRTLLVGGGASETTAAAAATSGLGLASGTGARPKAAPAPSNDEDDQEDDWRKMRASIKSRAVPPLSLQPLEGALRPAAAATAFGLEAPQSRRAANGDDDAARGATPLTARRSGANAAATAPTVPVLPLAASPSPEEVALRSARVNQELEARSSAYMEKAKSDAKAHTCACFEDLITFLEMHKLSGAYALAFSANGVEDLSQLLLMEDASLNKVIQSCDLDAVDEILLRDALSTARGGQRPPAAEAAAKA
eukprot:TRINITY_DN23948_c0_g1_i1.p1 TRINITY_DN23948_c0_g1~~TRINITY_DN23948_c0_g1_i1.p1  ORF type:complete len:307 (+),score=87.33 TRINITY_DN23948_c0_g1_i1:113-922(+)